MSRTYRKHADNAEIFGSKRYRYFIDVPINVQTSEIFYGEMDDRNIDWPLSFLEEACERFTGQPRWNGHNGGFARWGFVTMWVWEDRDELFTGSYHSNTFRFGFTRKRDAIAFKLCLP